MLKSSAAELNKAAEAVKQVLICRHSTQAGDIARRVHEKFEAERKVKNDLNRQRKSSRVDPKRSSRA